MLTIAHLAVAYQLLPIDARCASDGEKSQARTPAPGPGQFLVVSGGEHALLRGSVWVRLRGYLRTKETLDDYRAQELHLDTGIVHSLAMEAGNATFQQIRNAWRRQYRNSRY